MIEYYMEIDVSIIIVNYNTRNITAECIDSIFEKTEGVTFEIILVDNASNDGSRDVFSNDNRIVYIYNNENIGFGRANNKGLEIAKGRNIFFLNSDTFLVNNAVKILSDYLDKHSEVGACGGNLYSRKYVPVHSFKRNLPSVFSELDVLFAGILSVVYGHNREFNYKGEPMSIGYITGADLMVKHDLLNEVGGFNVQFFMYYEDTELCYRIKRSGYLLMSIPNAKILHFEGGSFTDMRKRLSESKARMSIESRDLYMRITHNRFCYSIICVIWYFTIFSRIIFYSLLNREKLKYWKRELLLLRELQVKN